LKTQREQLIDEFKSIYLSGDNKDRDRRVKITHILNMGYWDILHYGIK
jgi:hypothetical protein